MLESLAALHSGKFARVEHEKCMHKGDDFCQYIISWEHPPFIIWKVVLNYAVLLSIFISVMSFFVIPLSSWAISVSLDIFLVMILAVYVGFREKRELVRIVERQSNAAWDLLKQTDIHYSNLALIQELGQAISSILDINLLCKTVMNLMHKRLSYDRGLILLAGIDRTSLRFIAGYGYEPEFDTLLTQSNIIPDIRAKKTPLTETFIDQVPNIVEDISDFNEYLTEEQRILLQKAGVSKFICVPIVYEQISLGVLCVDNLDSIKPFTQSDVNLLQGIASQIAISINNASFFKKIQENEQRYRTIFENTSNATVIIDEDMTIVLANTEFEKLSGYSRDELEGKMLWVDFVREQDLEKMKDFHCSRRINPGASSSRYEFQFIDRQGNVKDIYLAVDMIPATKQSVASLLDITERKRSELEKKSLERQLQQAQKMESIGTLAGGIAHDFNNLLMGIQGNASLLMLDIDASHQFIERLKNIELYVRNGSELTKQLLGFARGGKYAAKPTVINELIAKSSEMFGRTKKEISIHRKLQDDIWTVEVDRGQIDQVLLNLYVNAWQAMPGGGDLYLETRNEVLDDIFVKAYGVKPGKFVKISVSDTGVGIDESTRIRVFDPFFSTKEMGRGTGLGLASAYGIIKNHGGIIDVYSEIGKGSTFVIFLPASGAEVISKDVEA